jgi:hypothetical protein
MFWFLENSQFSTCYALALFDFSFTCSQVSSQNSQAATFAFLLALFLVFAIRKTQQRSIDKKNERKMPTQVPYCRVIFFLPWIITQRFFCFIFCAKQHRTAHLPQPKPFIHFAAVMQISQNIHQMQLPSKNARIFATRHAFSHRWDWGNRKSYFRVSVSKHLNQMQRGS